MRHQEEEKEEEERKRERKKERERRRETRRVGDGNGERKGNGRNAELSREICRVSGLHDTEQTKGTRKIEREPRVERESETVERAGSILVRPAQLAVALINYN